MEKSVINDFINKHQLDGSFCDIAPKWYIPIVKQVLAKSLDQQAPFFIGINGCQGSGKSTLTDFIAEYLYKMYGLQVAVLSLDDFYYDQRQRQNLAETIHPLFKTRGVPGTHDTALMKHVLTGLKYGNLPIALPRFDKAADNPVPKTAWPVVVDTPHIVILEGWSWGVPPQADEALTTPVNALEADQDPEALWRSYSNNAIGNEYAPLYAHMDYWIMLKAPNFDCVFEWRKEQEHKLKAKSSGVGVMTDSQVATFIQHYQRLTEQALEHIPAMANIVVDLDPQRAILSVSGLES